MDAAVTPTTNRETTNQLSFDARPDSTETVSRLSFSSSRPTSSSSRPQTSSLVIFPRIHSHSFLTSSVNVWSYSDPAVFRLSRQNSHTSPMSHQPAKRRRFLSSLPSLIRPNEGNGDTLRQGFQSEVSTLLDDEPGIVVHSVGGLRSKSLPKAIADLKSECQQTSPMNFIPEEAALTPSPLAYTVDCETEVLAVSCVHQNYIFFCGPNSKLARVMFHDGQVVPNKGVEKLPKDTVYEQIKHGGRLSDNQCLVTKADNKYSIFITREHYENNVVRHLKAYRRPVLIHTFDSGQQIAVLSGQEGQIFNVLDGKLKATFADDTMENGKQYGDKDLIDGYQKYLAFAAIGSRYLSVYDVDGGRVNSVEVYPREEAGLGVNALAVTPDEKFVIIANTVLNDLEFYTLPGLIKEKSYKGDPNDYSRNFRIFHGGNFLLFPSELCNTVCVWFLHTGERRHYFQHENSIKFAESVSEDKIVTADCENIMRMWNWKPDEQLDLAKVVITDGLVWRFMKAYPGNKRYALLGYETHHDAGYLVIVVYDLESREAIRSAKVPYERYQLSSKKFELGPPQFLDDVRLVLSLARKLFILNLETMKIEKKFDDVLAADSNVAVVCSRGKDVLTFTEDRKNIRICEVASGNTTAILETNTNNRFVDIFVNRRATYCVATTDSKSRKTYAFDLERRSILAQVDLKHYMKSGVILEQPVLWSNDGLRCILFVSGFINKELQDLDTKLMDSFVTLVVWNVVDGALTSFLLDWQHMLQYCLGERNSAEPTTAVTLASDVVLCGCADFVIRAFTIKGELLYRLEGHQGLIDQISISPDQARCLTQSRDTGDLGCILWDLEARRKIAMFVFDKDPGDVLSVGNGNAIAFHTDGPDLQFINLMGDAARGYINDIKDEAKLFKGKLLDELIDPLTVDELALHRSTDCSDNRVKEEESFVLHQEESGLDIDNVDEWRRSMSFYMQSDDEEAMDIGRGPSQTSDVHLDGGLPDEEPHNMSLGDVPCDDDDDEGYYFIDGKPVPVREVRAKSKQLVDDVMADVGCSDWSDQDWEENGRAGQDGVDAEDDEGAYYFVDGEPIPASTFHGRNIKDTPSPEEPMLSSADGDSDSNGFHEDMDTDGQADRSYDDDEGFVFLNGKMVPVKDARRVVGIAPIEPTGDMKGAFVDESVETGSFQVPDSEILSRTGVELTSDEDDIR